MRLFITKNAKGEALARLKLSLGGINDSAVA